VLTAERPVADYFEEALHALSETSQKGAREHAKTVSNWVMTDVLRVVGEKKIRVERFPVSPQRLAGMIRLIQDGTISGKIAKELFEEMLGSDEDPATIVRKKGLVQVSDESSIEDVVDEVLNRSASQVEKYLQGNEKIFGFFVGETMKIMKGKGNPRVINEILRRKLDVLKSKNA
jgi:aspartyl-tRNA(Asn)/glutamyl-tRNA(Gln) amidotransferase subunit B